MRTYHYEKIAYSNALYKFSMKNENCLMKNFDILLFLLKTLIVVGTRSNRLNEAVRTSTHNLCFRAEIRKF